MRLVAALEGFVFLTRLRLRCWSQEILTTVGLLYLRLGENYRAFDFLGNSLTHDPKYARAFRPRVELA